MAFAASHVGGLRIETLRFSFSGAMRARNGNQPAKPAHTGRSLEREFASFGVPNGHEGPRQPREVPNVLRSSSTNRLATRLKSTISVTFMAGSFVYNEGGTTFVIVRSP